MRNKRPPTKPDFSMNELLELWNNCPDKSLCAKIADYIQEHQDYQNRNLKKSEQ